MHGHEGWQDLHPQIHCDVWDDILGLCNLLSLVEKSNSTLKLRFQVVRGAAGEEFVVQFFKTVFAEL